MDLSEVSMKNIFLLAVGGIMTFTILNFHFILFDDSVKVLQKTGLRLDHTFVDARGSKALKILLMPDLIGAGFKDALKDAERELDKNNPTR